MKIEDQNVCAELAREMKGLGAKQDGVWDWNHNFIEEKWELILSHYRRIYLIDMIDCFSAYTVAELGEMLKSHADILPVWNKYNMGARWFSDIYSQKGYCQINEETEADARAKVWIYLKKESIL